MGRSPKAKGMVLTITLMPTSVAAIMSFHSISTVTQVLYPQGQGQERGHRGQDHQRLLSSHVHEKT